MTFWKSLERSISKESTAVSGPLFLCFFLWRHSRDVSQVPSKFSVSKMIKIGLFLTELFEK